MPHDIVLSIKVAYITLIFKKTTAGYEGGRQNSINYVSLKAEELPWKSTTLECTAVRSFN